jgi:hypothetical protein
MRWRRQAEAVPLALEHPGCIVERRIDQSRQHGLVDRRCRRRARPSWVEDVSRPTKVEALAAEPRRCSIGCRFRREGAARPRDDLLRHGADRAAPVAHLAAAMPPKLSIVPKPTEVAGGIKAAPANSDADDALASATASHASRASDAADAKASPVVPQASGTSDAKASPAASQASDASRPPDANASPIASKASEPRQQGHQWGIID